MDSASEGRSATRGLATVALLKVNFDAGRDHIAMFVPFVLDTLTQMDADAVGVEDVRIAVRTRHQLALPTNTLTTLLGRVCTDGFLRREGGRYFRTDREPSVEDLRRKRELVEERQARLAEALRDACASRGIQIATTEDGLAMILDFLEQYHVALALDDVTGQHAQIAADPDEESDGKRRAAATAAFLQQVVLTDGELADVVQEMLEGFILQNALLLKDISTAARRFRNLHVFFDSILLFGALGLRGSVVETSMKELLSLLRDAGAVLDVFEPTIREMRRILAVYESRIGTSEGRLSLHQTDLTRYFLTNHYTPSDIRTVSSTVERNVRSLGFNIRDVPPRQTAYTLDERALGKGLADRPGGENIPRVVHDSDCVAGVLTYRRGRTSDSWDTAEAVFVTSSGMTVRSTEQWYAEQGGRGVPPIIHFLLLSNLAWLKRPASASRLKLHELVALCAAALRPSREAWQAFVKHLRKLEETGELSSDEVTAIVATSLTDDILVEEGVGEDSDAATLGEVVERVKGAYREQAEAEIGKARLIAEESQADALMLRKRVEGQARAVAKAICWGVAGILAVSLVTGTVISVANAATGSSPGLVGLVLAIVPLTVLGLLSSLTGFHLNGWRIAQEDRLTHRLQVWFGAAD